MERKYGGCLNSPKDLRDYKPSKAVCAIELPKEFSLGAYTIKDQGVINSCVAHTLSSMLEKYNDTFSTGWIYGYRPIGYYQGEGMYPREALNTLLKKGAVQNKDFDYNIEIPEAKSLVEKQLDTLEGLAKNVKITAYARLSSIEEIKSWIYVHNTAVPISIATTNLSLDKNNIIQIPSQYPNAGHAILVIGWNETGLIIQNSWGEDWGDKGCAILPYEYEINEAWGVTFTNYHATTSVSKPKFSPIRSIIQAIINFVKTILSRKE